MFEEDPHVTVAKIEDKREVKITIDDKPPITYTQNRSGTTVTLKPAALTIWYTRENGRPWRILWDLNGYRQLKTGEWSSKLACNAPAWTLGNQGLVPAWLEAAVAKHHPDRQAATHV